MNHFSELENNFISFERCHFFTNIEPEKGYTDLQMITDQYKKGLSFISENNSNLTNSGYMTKGELEFKNFSVKYRPELPYVLKDINFKVKPGRRVGIIGRTGCGKTTLMSAIYRSFEEYEGEILIDGHEISSVDLRQLRSKMTIIPQDPILFNGSLQINLDPYGLHKGDEIMYILIDFGVWDKFNLEGGLDFKIEASGNNISQGERQLLIMARALLNKNKLILFDEVTANIDIETGQLIQKAVEKHFRESTIIIIAHRLDTIMFCDDVLVLDSTEDDNGKHGGGKIVEYGEIKTLLNDNKSWFGKMKGKNDILQQLMG